MVDTDQEQPGTDSEQEQPVGDAEQQGPMADEEDSRRFREALLQHMQDVSQRLTALEVRSGKPQGVFRSVRDQARHTICRCVMLSPSWHRMHPRDPLCLRS